MPRWGNKSKAIPPAPISFVRIRITSQPGKYAALSRKGDLLVVQKAQAGGGRWDHSGLVRVLEKLAAHEIGNQ